VATGAARGAAGTPRPSGMSARPFCWRLCHTKRVCSARESEFGIGTGYAQSAAVEAPASGARGFTGRRCDSRSFALSCCGEPVQNVSVDRNTHGGRAGQGARGGDSRRDRNECGPRSVRRLWLRSQPPDTAPPAQLLERVSGRWMVHLCAGRARTGQKNAQSDGECGSGKVIRQELQRLGAPTRLW